jgi:tetratricopeptide (TPR) repeat protein
LRAVGRHDPQVPTAGWEAFDRVVRWGLGHRPPWPWPGELMELPARAKLANPRERIPLIHGLDALGEHELAQGIAEGDGSDAMLGWLLERGEHTRVRAALDQAEVEGPLTRRQAWLRGRALLIGGHHEAALADLEHAATDPKQQTWVAQHLAQALLALGRSTEALGLAEQAQALTPSDPYASQLVWEAQTITACEQGDTARAQAILAAAVPHLGPDTLGPWAAAVYRLHAAQASRAVVELATEALEQHGDHPFVRWLRGAASEALGELEQARSDLEGCLTGNPDQLRPIEAAVWDSLATLCHREGKLEEAARCARRALDLEPNRPATKALLEGLEG